MPGEVAHSPFFHLLPDDFAVGFPAVLFVGGESGSWRCPPPPGYYLHRNLISLAGHQVKSRPGNSSPGCAVIWMLLHNVKGGAPRGAGYQPSKLLSKMDIIVNFLDIALKTRLISSSASAGQGFLQSGVLTAVE